MDSWSKAAEHHSSGKPSHQDHTAQATINLHKKKNRHKTKERTIRDVPKLHQDEIGQPSGAVSIGRFQYRH